MEQQKQDNDKSGKRPDEKSTHSEQKPGGDSEATCRCKEVSKETPAGLLRLMLKDLAFWTKKTDQK